MCDTFTHSQDPFSDVIVTHVTLNESDPSGSIIYMTVLKSHNAHLLHTLSRYCTPYKD